MSLKRFFNSFVSEEREEKKLLNDELENEIIVDFAFW